MAEIQSRGGRTRYDYQIDLPGEDAPSDGHSPPGPWIVRRLLGDDAYARVAYVDCPVNDAADLQRLQKLPGLRCALLDGPGISDKGMALLAALPKLEALNLRATSKLSAAGLAHLQACSTLNHLSLNGPTDVMLAGLRNCRQLERLQIFRASITSDGCRHLAGLTQLRKLRFTACSSVNDACLAQLENLKQLEFLGLLQTAVADDGLRVLANFPKLRVLNLWSTSITDQGARHFASLKQLSSLFLCGTRIGDATVAQLAAACPRLRRLDLSATSITDASAVSLSQLRHLRFLNLIGTQFTDDGLERLNSLRELTVLQVGPHVTRSAAQRLKQKLPGCEIHGFDPRGSQIFAIQ